MELKASHPKSDNPNAEEAASVWRSPQHLPPKRGTTIAMWPSQGGHPSRMSLVGHSRRFRGVHVTSAHARAPCSRCACRSARTCTERVCRRLQLKPTAVPEKADVLLHHSERQLSDIARIIRPLPSCPGHVDSACSRRSCLCARNRRAPNAGSRCLAGRNGFHVCRRGRTAFMNDSHR
jgi:hypothetical protein